MLGDCRLVHLEQQPKDGFGCQTAKNTMKRKAMSWHSRAYYSIVSYSRVQYSTVQYSIV